MALMNGYSNAIQSNRNTPVVFQQFVNAVFTDLLDVSMIIYLNNILIFFKNKASHKGAHLRSPLRLWKHGLLRKTREM